MEAILQDLIKTNRTDLTQRTATKTVLVKGRTIDLAQIKRYMRRKGRSQPYLETWHNTQASQPASAIYKPGSLPSLKYAEKIWPPISDPGSHGWQSFLAESNSVDSYPLDLSFGNDNTLPYQLNLESPNSVLRKRAWASASEDILTCEEDRQPKRHRTSPSSNFACPFYKHAPTYYNPQNLDAECGRRYRTCAGPGWSSIRRLRCVRETLVIGYYFLTDQGALVPSSRRQLDSTSSATTD